MLAELLVLFLGDQFPVPFEVLLGDGFVLVDVDLADEGDEVGLGVGLEVLGLEVGGQLLD